MSYLIAICLEIPWKHFNIFDKDSDIQEMLLLERVVMYICSLCRIGLFVSKWRGMQQSLAFKKYSVKIQNLKVVAKKWNKLCNDWTDLVLSDC